METTSSLVKKTMAVQVASSESKTEAEFWLEALRRGTYQYEYALGHVREELKKGGLTLEDIGTSEKELKKLRVLGAKTSAKK